MKHLSVLRRWARTARQLRFALLGLALLFVTLVVSTLDFTLQLNRYTIASSQDSLRNTARSGIATLDSYLERQMSYVQRAATAIASLPQGSSEEEFRQLLDEYFQRSDFAQMWAVSLDKQAISSQGVSLDLSSEEALDSAFEGHSGYSSVYTSRIYQDDRFYLYVPVRVSPEQPVTGAVLGVLQVDQLEEVRTLYGLSDESRVAVFQPDGMLVYASDTLKAQLQDGAGFWDTEAGQILGQLPPEEGVFGTAGSGDDAVAWLCVPTGIRDWYLYQDVPQSALLATNAQETKLVLIMAAKMLAASVVMLMLLATYHRRREAQVQRAEDSLRTSNQLLAMALQHTAITLFVYDLETHTMTPCAGPRPGEKEAESTEPALLVQNGTVAPQHSTSFLALFHQIRQTQEPVQGDFLLHGPDRSEYRWTRVTLTAVNTPGQAPSHAIVTFEDITEERRREDELRQRANRDPLTDLFNRRGLRVRVSELLAQPAPPKTVALLMMDLDHFKEVNDMLGHPVGDLLLRQVARLLEQLAPAPAVPVRLGGDEFIVLLPGADWTQAETLAGRICDQLPGLASKLELGVPVGVSVGVHLFDPAAVSLNQAYQQADVALYTAKRNRGCWVSTRSLREL